MTENAQLALSKLRSKVYRMFQKGTNSEKHVENAQSWLPVK